MLHDFPAYYLHPRDGNSIHFLCHFTSPKYTSWHLKTHMKYKPSCTRRRARQLTFHKAEAQRLSAARGVIALELQEIRKGWELSCLRWLFLGIRSRLYSAVRAGPRILFHGAFSGWAFQIALRYIRAWTSRRRGVSELTGRGSRHGVEARSPRCKSW